MDSLKHDPSSKGIKHRNSRIALTPRHDHNTSQTRGTKRHWDDDKENILFCYYGNKRNTTSKSDGSNRTSKHSPFPFPFPFKTTPGYHPWLDPAPLPPVIKGLKVPKSSSSTEKGNIHITKSVSSEMQCNSDRAWSDAEEGDIVSSSFDVVGGYEETSIQKKKKEAQVIKRQVHSNGTRMTLPQSKKLSQRISDNAIWEDQQLLKSGVARGTELQTDYDNEEERRVTLLVHDAKPPFLDGRIVFTKQADPIIPLKDPTSDMAKISRKGSNLVREVHEKQSMDKSRQRFWELPGSKLGNILGVEKSAEQFDADTSLVGEHGEVDFKGDAKFAKHMKKGETVSDFAKSKSLSEQRQYLPIFSGPMFYSVKNSHTSLLEHKKRHRDEKSAMEEEMVNWRKKQKQVEIEGEVKKKEKSVKQREAISMPGLEQANSSRYWKPKMYGCRNYKMDFGRTY